VNALVVRLSSLGDVVLAAAVTGALGEVGFVTDRRYHPLVTRFPGVVRAYAPDEVLPALPLYDLQHHWKTRRYRATRRVERQDLRRRLRVWAKTAPADPVVERYGRCCGVRPAPPPWLPLAVRGGALVLAPGAAHATKRWPWWRELAAAWPGELRVVGGPDDALVAELGGVPEAGFDRTLAAFEGARGVVAGDTGLLHLAAACGLPTVGLFGPTTSADGFWQPAYGRALELPLACRPCSRYGGATCPVGDHACLRGIPVDAVLAAVEAW